MIQIVLIIWGAVYALWLLSTVAMGEFKQQAVSITITYLMLPFLVVIGLCVLLILMVITPLFIVFSKKTREMVIEQRKSVMERSVKKEGN